MSDISRDAVDAMMQGVTEGPWEAESGHEQQNGQLYWQVTNGAHAIMQNQFCWCQGDHAANARFIAAARELVPALRAALDDAEAERDAAIAAARIAHDALWELNPNNYDHDEVCKVNNGSVEAILTLAPIIGETHGKTPEWWAERAAHLGAKP